MCQLTVYGQDDRLLLENNAVPNLNSTNLAEQLALAVYLLEKTIKLADKSIETCHGVAKNILMSFEELEAKMNFLVVDGVPVRIDSISRDEETKSSHQLGWSVR